jgi:molybdate transport system substrate-binding protein
VTPRRLAAALTALALAIGAAACGDDGGSSPAGKPRLVVSAASSMTEALTSCSQDYPEASVKLSFAGSDDLATQIEQGVKPDVYAAANTRLPDQLHQEGRLGQPVEFATNTFVLAVSKDSGIDSIEGLTQKGVKVVIGSKTVPIGYYTRDTLAQLPPDQEKAILANVRSEEPDVKGIVGKLIQGAADAGFTYVTDVNGTDGALKAVDLPRAVEPQVTYAAGVVTGAKQPAAGKRFVDGLASGGCADALRKAGFGPAP